MSYTRVASFNISATDAAHNTDLSLIDLPVGQYQVTVSASVSSFSGAGGPGQLLGLIRVDPLTTLPVGVTDLFLGSPIGVAVSLPELPTSNITIGITSPVGLPGITGAGAHRLVFRIEDSGDVSSVTDAVFRVDVEQFIE